MLKYKYIPPHKLRSQSSTPEPTPRMYKKPPVGVVATTLSPTYANSLQNTHEYYGSANSLSVQSAQATPAHLARNSDMRGSSLSLSSSAGGTMRSRKNRRAPAPPTAVKELFPSTETVNSSKASSPGSSTVSSPKSSRKKRPAPAPPKPARLDPSLLQAQQQSPLQTHEQTASKNLHSYPLQSESDSKLSDEEKALLEGNKAQLASLQQTARRLIPLDASLLEDADAEELGGSGSQSDDLKQQQLQRGDADSEERAVVYRRVIKALPVDTPTHDGAHPLMEQLMSNAHNRQLEKMKDNKEAKNRNRQSQILAGEDTDALLSGLMLGYSNKSAHGKWKRRKGPAPALPVPPRRVLQMLPLQEIRHELDIIEVQQQGLEKQGVVLEKMIRDRCENTPQAGATLKCDAQFAEADAEKTNLAPNSKEVEDLILQLFELVNEKNELFRRQAELMYLRRQHRLEQEQADLEYEIRVLMAQPERNKTDTDKSREEALIARLVEVVQLRNEVIDCLEMDRLREAEEDLSIKERLEEHNAKRENDSDSCRKSTAKLSKKEKKKQKESKKLGKNSKKIDADKDADESELNDKQKLKKKKKRFSFLGALA